MNKLRLVCLLAAAVIAPLAAACGGDDDAGRVPDDAVAVVGGDTIKLAEFEALLDQARRTYRAQQQPFPTVGTPAYEQLKQRAVQYLVQRAQFEQKADDLDIEVTDEQVDARLETFKKQNFASDTEYRASLAKQGLDEELLRRDMRARLISERIFKTVTEDISVTDAEIEAHYKKNRKQYERPVTREVRHILVKQRALADRLYTQLRAGASFPTLARRYSQDRPSKVRGGRMTVFRGQIVPQFERVVFELQTRELSTPVKTRHGFHIIQALGPVKPKSIAPLAQVETSIRQQLLQTKRSEAMRNWLEETKKEFEGEIAYRAGYAPAQTAATAPSDR